MSRERIGQGGLMRSATLIPTTFKKNMNKMMVLFNASYAFILPDDEIELMWS
jgi:hypothetical protein